MKPAPTTTQLQRALLESAVELVARTSRINRFLRDIGSGPSGEFHKIAAPIATILSHIEDQCENLLRPLAELSGCKEGDYPELPLPLCDVFRNALAKFSYWLIEIHQLLLKLPLLPATRESSEFLRLSFGPFYEEQSPSVLLFNLVNAAQVNFCDLIPAIVPGLGNSVELEPRRVVLQLSLSDHRASLMWPVLGHEMGHAIDIHHDVSSSVVAHLGLGLPFSNWAQELAADLIAAETLGYCPMLAIVSIERCIYPLIIREIHQGNERHPATYWRIQAVAEHLKALYGSNGEVMRDIEAYADCWEAGLRVAYSDEKERSEVVRNQENVMDLIIRPICTALAERIAQLNLPRFESNDQSVRRCIARLRRGRPIAAQGLERSELRNSVTAYLKLRNGKELAIEEFDDLTKKFQESPLSMATIFQSGATRRRRLIDELTSDPSIFWNQGALPGLCKELESLDAVIAKSIHVVRVHDEMAI